MNYVLDMSVLRNYSKQSCVALTEMSHLLGMSSNTLSRYVNGVRNPDLHTLLHLCNTLHLSVGNFIHHSDLLPPTPSVCPEDLFHPIRFRYDAIERFREEHELTRIDMLQYIRKHSGCQLDSSTYVRMVNSQRIGLELPIGFLNAYDLPLHYLFDDPQLAAQQREAPSATLCIPQSYLDKLHESLRRLEEENTLLLSENRSLKKQLKKQKAGTTPLPDLTTRRLLNKVRQALSELEGWCDPTRNPLSEE